MYVQLLFSAIPRNYSFSGLPRWLHFLKRSCTPASHLPNFKVHPERTRFARWARETRLCSRFEVLISISTFPPPPLQTAPTRLRRSSLRSFCLFRAPSPPYGFNHFVRRERRDCVNTEYRWPDCNSEKPRTPICGLLTLEFDLRWHSRVTLTPTVASRRCKWLEIKSDGEMFSRKPDYYSTSNCRFAASCTSHLSLATYLEALEHKFDANDKAVGIWQ